MEAPPLNLGQTLGETPEAARAPLIRRVVADVRAGAARSLAAGASGLAVCHEVSDAFDGLIVALATASAGPAGEVALVATGGWGRRETCPYSDLDLLFLVKDAPTDDVRALAERLLYPLWDAGLEVGHAVRGVGEAVALAGDDLATMTALLDARHLVGPQPLTSALAAALGRELIRRGDPNLFVDRLAQEKRARHARFGDSVFLLEPNLKHGQGALRDLATGLWAARARWRVRDFGELPPLGQTSPRQATAMQSAREFMLRVRSAMHLFARRRQDQLTFELQEAIAPEFFPAAKVASGEHRPVAPAVEELMRRYYLHARAVVRESDRLLDRARIPPHRPPVIRPLDPPSERTFIAFNGHIALRDPEILRERPGEIVRLFRVALAQGLPIYGHTLDLVAELVAQNPSRLATDAEARAHFVALLGDPRDDHNPSLLEQMNDLGLLAALMPEFGPCRGRVQHDLYHVYTVDQHQLYAVALLKRIARGELAKEAPTATAAIAQVERPAALYLGTLLHDVGKPLGKGHAEKGARLTQTIARRLGLGEADAHQAEFLVKQHLIMSHLSQRRDLNDVSLIAGFAETMRDEETLRELYLLTYCDTSMTAPGNMTEWKAQLLAELYDKTRAFFRRGPDLSGADRSALATRRRRRVAELLGETVDEPRLAAWLGSMPDRYFAALQPQKVVRHVRLSRSRGERAAVIDVAHQPRRGVSELFVCAVDVPGLLAKVCGVLVANRIDVAAAHIASRAGTPGEALDVFVVRDRQGRAIPAADPRWARVEHELAGALRGEIDVDALVAARQERSFLKARVTPAVTTEIVIDNAVARDYTVLDVFTQDRPGVLYAITRTLAGAGLDIGLSRVATEADRVADVFYVRDGTSGQKLDDPTAQAALRHALEAALAALTTAGKSG
jgi:[protein-PII] uridylyltransferase